MSPRDEHENASRSVPLLVRGTLRVARWLLRRASGFEVEERAEVLSVLSARLQDVRRDRWWAAYLVRATRECGALLALARLPAPDTERRLTSAGWADDFVLAVKGLVRRPAFGLSAVVILALGIGAGTAAFSVLDSVLYRAPHYDQDQTLATIWKEMHGGAFQISSHSREEIELYRQAESFSAVAASTTDNVPVYDGERAKRLATRSVDLGFLPMLGIDPVAGRIFSADDIGADRILISESLWRDRFGRDTGVLGQLLEVDGVGREIVGVLPPSASALSLHQKVDIWMPLDLEADFDRFTIHALVRLRPGVEVSAAAAELESLMAANLEPDPDEPPMKTLVRLKQDDRVPGDAAAKLWMIFGGVGLLLLTACANATSLALTRDANRADELRTRLALGASTGRVVRLLALEGLTLGVVASLLGGLASVLVVPVLMRFAPGQISGLVDAGAAGGARTAFFLGLVSLGTAALVAALPIARFRLQGRLGRRLAHADGRSTRRWGTALVTAQVATAFILLMASSLLLRSFERLMSIDPGYALDRLQVTVQLPPGVEEPDAVRLFYDQVKDEIDSLPGLPHASWTDVPTSPPIFGGVDFEVDGEAKPIGQPGGLLAAFSGDADMFAALGIDLLAGRTFAADDPREVIVLGKSLAQALFADEDPVGRSLRLSDDGDPYTIVGVAENVKAAGPEEPLGPWETYRPLLQTRLGARTLVLAFERDSIGRIGEVRAAVARVDPRAPLDRIETLGASWHSSMARPRFLVEMVVISAALTLALALFGLYSVLSYAVAQRRREIGLRMALGANAGSVRWLVIRQSALAVLAGLGLGGAVSLVFRRGLEDQLFETPLTDAWSVAGALGLLLGATMIASWLPATRATRIEPSRSLREES